MANKGSSQFSSLLLEGLDHYRKGRMLDAVRAWEEAYLLEPTNLRAREFLRSALERIHAVMSPAKPASPGAPAAAPHPWLPPQKPLPADPAPARKPPAPPEEPAKKKPAPPEPVKKAAEPDKGEPAP